MTVLLSILNCNAQKINGSDLQVINDVKQVNLMLTKGSEVTFSGFDKSAAEMLQPEFFSVTGSGSATFLGLDGSYNIYYADGVLHIANPDMKFPETIWITGAGIGHPKNKVQQGWSMDLPKIFMCNRVSDNAYRVTLRLDEGFDFKSFNRRSWDGDASFGSNIFTPYPASSIEKAFWIDGNTGNSHPTGDFISAWEFTPGVYTLEFDVSKGTCCLIELTGEETSAEEYSVNGVKMEKSVIEGHSYYSAELNLKKGEMVEFANIRHLRYLLQPEYFINRGVGYEFSAPDGRYRISYANERELIYVERIDKTSFDEDVLFLTGANFAHPATSGAFAEDFSAYGNENSGWGWQKPRDYVCCVNTAPGVFETNLYLKNGFMFRGYKAKANWDTVVSPATGYTVKGADGIGGTYNFDTSGPGTFTPGSYHIVFDKNENTATFTPVKMSEIGDVQSGVESVAKDGIRSVVGIFTIQGIRVDNEDSLPSGIYIIKYSDGTASKCLKN